MKIRHIYLSDEDRKRLLELVEEAAAEIDQIDSDEELDQLEAELSEQLQKIVEEDHTQQLAFHTQNIPISFKKKPSRYMAMPGFALVAVVILSVVGKHSLSEPDFLTKGHTSGFPCDIEIVQACGAGSADFHVENVLAADAVTVRPGTPVFFRASCPNAASLTIQDINGQQVIISDLTSAQMALLTSQGNKIQWQPVASNLQFAFGDVVMTIKMQLSSDVCQ